MGSLSTVLWVVGLVILIIGFVQMSLWYVLIGVLLILASRV